MHGDTTALLMNCGNPVSPAGAPNPCAARRSSSYPIAAPIVTATTTSATGICLLPLQLDPHNVSEAEQREEPFEPIDYSLHEANSKSHDSYMALFHLIKPGEVRNDFPLFESGTAA